MVLRSNPRLRRAQRTAGQSWKDANGVEHKGAGNKAGTAKALNRPYNLNFLPGLGACCKQKDRSAALTVVINRLHAMVKAAEFLKVVADEFNGADGQANDITVVRVVPGNNFEFENIVEAAQTATVAELATLEADFGDVDQTVGGIADGQTGAQVQTTLTAATAVAGPLAVVLGVIKTNGGNGAIDVAALEARINALA